MLPLKNAKKDCLERPEAQLISHAVHMMTKELPSVEDAMEKFTNGKTEALPKPFHQEVELYMLSDLLENYLLEEKTDALRKLTHLLVLALIAEEVKEI
jgi:hypothetical protein